MNAAHPPRIARWLLSHFGYSPNNAAIVGDLDEQFGSGRPAGWYNKQAFLAFLTGWYDATRMHVFMGVSVLAGWGAEPTCFSVEESSSPLILLGLLPGGRVLNAPPEPHRA